MKMTIDTTITTIHAVSRAKERCHIKNVRSAEKNVMLAVAILFLVGLLSVAFIPMIPVFKRASELGC